MERPGEQDADPAGSGGDAPAPERLAVAVEVDGGDAELVADRLFSLGAGAVAEHARSADRVTLVADLGPHGVEQLVALGHDVRVLEPSPVWSDGWREHAQTWRCGEHMVLRPAWLAPADLAPGDVEILVEPGNVFGSGSHATTRLCVAALERVVRPGSTVLDVGCGSGVLGVAAARLGAASVEAIDVDPDAVHVTSAMAELNGVADLVTVSTTPLEQVGGTYDVVVANLLAPIIDALASHLIRRVAPGGTLILSGLLAGQRDRASAACPGWSVVLDEESDGWVAVELTGRGPGRAAHG